MRAVVTGTRSAASGPLSGVFAQRLLLLPADPVDLAMAGLSTRVAPANPGPGRALEPASGREIQIAVSGPGPSLGERTAYLKGLSERLVPDQASAPAGLLPSTVPALPERVGLDHLQQVSGLLAVGVGFDGAAGFRLATGQRRVAVLGPAGSGRTSALAILASGLIRLGYPVATVSPGGAPVMPGVTGVAPADVDALIALRHDRPNLAVLVDDAERLAGTPIEAVLAEIARLVDHDLGFVGVASTVREAVDRPRGLAGIAAAGECALLLGRRQPGDEHALGLRLLVPFSDCPGRAHLVRHGLAEVVQLAHVR